MIDTDCNQITIPVANVKNKQPLIVMLAGPQLETVKAVLQIMVRDESRPVFDFANYRKEWSKAVAKAKLGTWDAETQTRTGVRMHDCRVSAAINLLDSGVDERLVLKIGGWKTREMMDRYNVSNPKRLKAAIERAGKFVKKRQAAKR